MTKINKLHRIKLFAIALIFSLSYIFSPFSAIVAAQSKDNDDGRLPIDFSSNGILYYDDCGGVPSSGGTDSPEGTQLEFPTDLDEDAMAKAIDEYIASVTPDSILLNTGKYIVASSKKANVSPFLTIAHAKMESNIGKPGVSSFVDQANNSFGRSATASQPHVAGNSKITAYKWSSGKASVDHTEPENQKPNTSDFPAYLHDVYEKEIESGDLDKYLVKYVDESEALTVYKDSFLKTIKDLTNASQGGNSARAGSSGSANTSGSDSDNDSSAPSRDIGRVYIVGDSITEGAANLYKEKLKEAGASDVKVSASVSSNLDSGGTTGTRRSGIASLKADKDYIKSANTVIIAHGTNALSHSRSGDAAIKEAIKIVKDSGSKAKIYWVDVAVSNKSSLSDASVKGVNKAINSNTSEGYSVISWAKAVDPEANGDIGHVKHNSEYLSGDGVHLTQKGSEKLVETVVNTITNNQGDKSNNDSDANACCDSSNSPVSGTVNISGGTNAEKVFNYLTAKGFSAEQAAAVAGNLMQESGGGTEDLQADVVNSIGAVGIVQWLFERKTRFMEAAQRMGKPWQDIEFQIYFMGWEIGLEGDETYGGVGPTHKFVGEELKNANSIEEATKVWLERYEIPCTPGYCGHEMAIRVPYAKQIYEKYGDGAGSGPSSTRSGGAACGESKEPASDFVWYNQNDPEWQKSGMPIAVAGCGPTSLAMILATKKDKNITPVEVADYLRSIGSWDGNGLQWHGVPKAAEKWGMKSNDLGTDWEKAKSELKAGKLLMLSGAGAAPFTSGGHLIVARGLTDDGKIIIANPAPMTDTPENTPYSIPIPGIMNIWSFE